MNYFGTLCIHQVCIRMGNNTGLQKVKPNQSDHFKTVWTVLSRPTCLEHLNRLVTND